MLAAVQFVAEEGARAGVTLPITPIAYGILAFTGLMVMLIATYAFKSVWTRH